MKVKLLVSRSGDRFSQSAGEEITVDDAEGLRMIKAGQAEMLDSVETASKKTATRKAVKK